LTKIARRLTFGTSSRNSASRLYQPAEFLTLAGIHKSPAK
jgi:hypothetical protein